MGARTSSGRTGPAATARRGPRLLFVSSEIYPLAKTGGLADVCAGLPRALARLGAEPRLLMPAYESALDAARDVRCVADLGELLGVDGLRLLEAPMPDSGLTVWLLDAPTLYRRPGSLYQDARGEDWPDNWLRFGLLAHVAAKLALGAAPGGWRPDVLHCHDWHTGLAPYLVQRAASARPRTVFTVHNAAFQGNFAPECAARLGLPPDVLTPEAMEFWGRLSFLKAGMRYADRVNTVSRTHARELCTPEYGFGMEGVFARRDGEFAGILNGIDTERWDPARDSVIAAPFSPEAPEGKAACKAALQRDLGLAAEPGAPLLIFASRVTWQKMADVTLERLPEILERHPQLQFALLGTGERALEQGFERLASRYPGRMSVRISYADQDERHLQAGADMLLHGSRYEPCGLAHKIAMRYGVLPIVRRTGGLADTVSEGVNGFVFDAPTGDELLAALGRCVETYEASPARWAAMRDRAMRADYGWERPALEYLELYSGAQAATA